MQINGAQQGPVHKSLYSLYSDLNSQHSHKWNNILIQCVSHAGGSQVIFPYLSIQKRKGKSVPVVSFIMICESEVPQNNSAWKQRHQCNARFSKSTDRKLLSKSIMLTRVLNIYYHKTLVFCWVGICVSWENVSDWNVICYSSWTLFVQCATLFDIWYWVLKSKGNWKQDRLRLINWVKVCDIDWIGLCRDVESDHQCSGII